MKTNYLFMLVLFMGLGANAQNNYMQVGTSSLPGGHSNTLLGGSSAASGTENWSLGFSGNYNAGFGYRALRKSQNAFENTAVGAAAMDNNVDGNQNVAVGRTALLNNISGVRNVGIGYEALHGNTGDSNTALGSQSGRGLLTGSGNLFLGAGSGAATSSDYSSRLYINAGASDTPLIYGEFDTRQLNFFVNGSAGSRATITSFTNHTSGLNFARLKSNSPVGTNPGTGVLTVDPNGDVILVNDATSATPNDDWKLIGNAATAPSTAFDVAAIPGTNFLGTTGNEDMVFRRNNQLSGFLGTSTTILGVTRANPVMLNNTFIGTAAGNLWTGTSTENTFIGASAGGGGNADRGNQNTFVGFRAGFGTATGNPNLAQGNTFLGHRAGASNGAGSRNTFVGRSSGINLASGNDNVFIGAVIVPTGVATPTSAGNNTNSTIILADGAGNQRLYIHNNGNAGIGLASNAIPSNRLEISSGIANTSGERFTNLTSTFNPIAVNTKFLTVDANGDVVLEKVDFSGSGSGTDTSLYKNDGQLEATGSAVTGQRTVTMNGKNLVFLTNSATEEQGKGRVYIGDSPLFSGDYRLYVEKGILTEKIKVAVRNPATHWADYVFNDDYKLMSLKEVEAFVKENKHLPGVASANELAKDGLDLGSMQAKQMEKIEELTLHLIEQNKQLEKQAQEIDELKAQVKLLLEKK